jgi:hypothetical protein
VPAGTTRPVLAPLTALLVLQASLYQTIRSGIRKVASVAVGVLVAVGVSEFIGFSWWQLAFVIAAALTIGRVLRLGDDLLEVPISAMLIFSSVGQHSAASGRVVDTLVGTAAGLAGGLIFGAPRVKPAREAVGTLSGRLAELLDKMAGDLRAADGCAGNSADGAVAHAGAAAGNGTTADGAAGDGVERAAGPGPDCVNGWLVQARALRDEIERVDDSLRQATDSIKLNPRSQLGRGLLRIGGRQPAADDLLVTEVALRGGLETLEHATVTVRGLARSILDSTGIDSDHSPVRDERTRARLADVLGNLAEAIRTYGRVVQLYPSESDLLKSELAGQLAAAHRVQDELAAVLEPRVPDQGGSSEWPLRGEILTHVDRLRTGLRPDSVPHSAPPRPLPRPRSRYGGRLPAQRDSHRDTHREGSRREGARREGPRPDGSRRGRAKRDEPLWVSRPFAAKRP